MTRKPKVDLAAIGSRIRQLRGAMLIKKEGPNWQLFVATSATEDKVSCAFKDRTEKIA